MIGISFLKPLLKKLIVEYLCNPYVVAFGLVLLTLHFVLKPAKYEIKGKNVLITGGSSGIGLELAKECAKRGAATLTIVARKMDGPNGMKEAEKKIKEVCPDQEINLFS